MPVPENSFPSGKRKSENSIKLTYIKKAHLSKKELEDHQQDEVHRIPTTFADIPEGLFVKLCGYLRFSEIMRMRKVCRGWKKLTRSSAFWERTDVVSLNLPAEDSQPFLEEVPPCVKELRIGKPLSSEVRQTFHVPALYNTLIKRCPTLDVLIIENAFLENTLYYWCVDYGFILNTSVPVAQQKTRYYSRVQYQQPTEDTDFYSLVSRLQDISVLSLRGCVLAVNGSSNEAIRNIPSKIRILDLTYCSVAMDQTIKTFCQLPYLEELYLAAAPISVNGVAIIMQEVPALKVLDLDNTVIGGETFTILKRHGSRLIKLYLGQTAVKNCDMIDIEEETFPVLQKLCLQRTAVTEMGIGNLLLSVHSLKEIVLTQSRVRFTGILEHYQQRVKFTYDDNDANENCNHFLQNKFQRGF